MSSIAGVKADFKKKPVDSRRVVVVLASLVVTLAVMAVVLSLLEGQPITSASVDSPYLLGESAGAPNMTTLLQTATPLIKNHWSYIIVYQSGDLNGNAAALRSGREIGGVLTQNDTNNADLGVDFHFVVDNANNGMGKPDGNIQVGTAWRSQLSTAPYYSWPHFSRRRYPSYANVIGICLVGNVNSHPFTQAQMHSLTQLVQALQHQCGIPSARVKLQWDIADRPTGLEASFSRSLQGSLAP